MAVNAEILPMAIGSIAGDDKLIARRRVLHFDAVAAALAPYPLIAAKGRILGQVDVVFETFEFEAIKFRVSHYSTFNIFYGENLYRSLPPRSWVGFGIGGRSRVSVFDRAASGRSCCSFGLGTLG